MSAASTLVFMGLRFQIEATDEIEELEIRTHSHQQMARQASLDHYWGNFGEPGEQWFSFIGKRLGVVGLEGESEISLANTDLEAIQRETQEKLRMIDLDGEARLYIQLMPDV